MSCFATISPGKSSPSLADPLGTSGSCSSKWVFDDPKFDGIHQRLDRNLRKKANFQSKKMNKNKKK
jgi:hypothetical protein